MKHTPTPWEIRGNIIFVANSYKSIATIHVCENYDILKGDRIRDVEQEANANRIVDCVEALAGVENPQEFMEFVNREPSEKVRHLLRLNDRIKALEDALTKIEQECKNKECTIAQLAINALKP